MAPDHKDLEEALDAVIARFGRGAHEAEAARAREEHAARTGRVFEDDEIFEARTVAFLEWFVLERPLDGERVAPVVVALRDEDVPPVRREALAALARSHRSVFVVDELPPQGGGRVTLVDLLGGGRFAVDERRRLHGVSEGDLVTARLIAWRGAVVFGRTFTYHPAGAREAVTAHLRRIREGGGTRSDGVDHIESLRVRALRYKHVAPERVYESATSEFQTGGK